VKIFCSETTPVYATYTFQYAVYAIVEQSDKLADLYRLGFLPYTGNYQSGSQQDLFYLARSIRVNLEIFKETSENRRLLKKAAELGIVSSFDARSDSLSQSKEVLDFCEQYAERRFSGAAMSRERLIYVFSRRIATHVITFRASSRENALLGYVLCCVDDEMLHYWFAFLDETYMQSHHIGKVIMFQVIMLAKARGLKYVYLGTCYGEKALYKVRDHFGVQWFDGALWNSDVDALKARCVADDSLATPRNVDAFKTLDRQQQQSHVDSVIIAAKRIFTSS